MKIEVKPQVENAPKPSLKMRLFGDKQKKIRTISCVIVGIVAILLVNTIYAKFFIKENSDGTLQKTSLLTSLKKTEEKKVESPLSGVLYSESVAKKHPLGVMIENHPDARPQSGLDKAEIVYEAITEGGITRFLGIFGPREADEVGPVRSARTFFVSWIQEYDGYYAHAGGSKDGLAQITSDNVMDLPHTTGYFERQPRAGIASEHTLYTSIANLYKLAEAKKYDTNASFTSLQFKDDEELAKRGAIEKITIPFSTESYEVQWLYDKTENIYKRVIAGVPHKDKTSGNQLTAKNIIIQTVARAPIALPGAKPTFKFTTEGSGKAIIMQDGQKVEGTWKKSTTSERTKFFDSTGAEIKFNRGVFWYEIVPPEVTATITEKTVSTENL